MPLTAYYPRRIWHAIGLFHRLFAYSFVILLLQRHYW